MLGTIADDVTGATDVAATFRRAGLRTLIVFGIPATSSGSETYDAVVVALKIRTAPRADAVRLSLQALEWLRSHGSTRIYLKFCSTFDSTPRGNIGPVLDALADALGADQVLLTPSSPAHGRTQYLGHLFVGDVLLSESPMRQHPLTPMTDSLLTRVLQCQTAHRVGLIPLATVRSGRAAIRAAADRSSAGGCRYLLVDALDDHDLREVGATVVDDALVAGAAGLAAGLADAIRAGSLFDDADPVRPVRDPAGGDALSGGGPELDALAAEALGAADGVRPDRDSTGDVALGDAGALRPDRDSADGASLHPAGAVPQPGDPVADAPAVVLAGSCSARTLEQVEVMRARRPSYRLDLLTSSDPGELAAGALDWYEQLPPGAAPLIYSSLPPEQLAAVQSALGVDPAAELVEKAMGLIAAGLVARGVRRLVAAGGETSGAVISALGVEGGEIGPEAAPGVPWIYAGPMAVLLKSGNFGEPDLFLTATATEPGPGPASP